MVARYTRQGLCTMEGWCTPDGLSTLEGCRQVAGRCAPQGRCASQGRSTSQGRCMCQRWCTRPGWDAEGGQHHGLSGRKSGSLEAREHSAAAHQCQAMPGSAANWTGDIDALSGLWCVVKRPGLRSLSPHWDRCPGASGPFTAASGQGLTLPFR